MRYIVTHYRTKTHDRNGNSKHVVVLTEVVESTHTATNGETRPYAWTAARLVLVGSESSALDLRRHLLDSGQVVDAGMVRSTDVVREWSRDLVGHDVVMSGGAYVFRGHRCPMDVGRRIGAYLQRVDASARRISGGLVPRV